MNPDNWITPNSILNEGATIEITISLPPGLESILTSAGIKTPKPIRCRALIDTGASLTCICSSLLDGIGLSPARHIPLRTASHLDLSISIYRVRLDLHNPDWTVEQISVGSLEFQGQDFDALIGRDLLQYCQLIYDGPAGRFSLCIPS